MTIHHYGFLTKNIEKSLCYFEKLGYRQISSLVKDKERGIDIIFIESTDGQLIELVSPNTENSVVSNIVKNQSNSIYHICFIVKSIEQTIENLVKENFILINEPQPAIAFDGKRVAFMISRYTGIIELLED